VRLPKTKHRHPGQLGGAAEWAAERSQWGSDMTNKIMVIRHGEKPGTPIAAPGINALASRAADDASLTEAGWRRANALVGIFNPPAGAPPAGIGIPTSLFAAAVKDQESGKRPMQTLMPLAFSFHPPLAINTSIKASNPAELAEAAKSAGGVVLIAWKHKYLIDISRQLAPAAVLPPKWPKHRFDVVFVFDLDGSTYRFTQILEHALPTDSEETL
jgi:hypothetical protein